MSRKPNVLLITADQLRRDALGACGNRLIRTPRIDGLAEGGIVFDENELILVTTVAGDRSEQPIRRHFELGRQIDKRGLGSFPGRVWGIEVARAEIAGLERQAKARFIRRNRPGHARRNFGTDAERTHLEGG